MNKYDNKIIEGINLVAKQNINLNSVWCLRHPQNVYLLIRTSKIFSTKLFKKVAHGHSHNKMVKNWKNWTFDLSDFDSQEYLCEGREF